VGAFFRRLGTFLGALLGGVIGAVMIFPLGLVVSGWVIIPLTMAMAALLSALAASWLSNLLARHQTRSRLLVVVGMTEAMAGAVTALLVVLLLVTESRRVSLGPPAGFLGLSVLVLAGAASLAASRLRGPAGASRDTWLAAALLLGSVLVVLAVLFVAARLGLVGA